MADEEVQDPGAAFAALMSGAAEAAGVPADVEAPFGYTRDATTGEMRPKRAKGRPRKSPSLDELRAERQESETSGAWAPPGEDRPPSDKGPKPQARDAGGQPVPYHPGRIARGMAKWYRRIGRFWKIYRPATGQAFIDCSDDIGEAWEEVARGNPKVRKVLNWLVTGGAWGALFLAHAPIFAAMLMEHEERASAKFADREERRAKDAASRGQVYQMRDYQPFPLTKWLSAFAEEAYDSLPDTAGDGGLSKDDMSGLMGVASAMMQQMGFVAPGDLHPSQVPPEVVQAAAAAAGGNGRPQPQDHKRPLRAQPHRATRAKRKAA